MAGATQEVASSIQAVSGAASETGKVSGGMTQAAQDLAQQAQTMRARVDGFLGELRAA